MTKFQNLEKLRYNAIVCLQGRAQNLSIWEGDIYTKSKICNIRIKYNINFTLGEVNLYNCLILEANTITKLCVF